MAQKIITLSNGNVTAISDGSGSNIDADLLDGLQSTDFSLSTSNVEQLTATKNLTVNDARYQYLDITATQIVNLPLASSATGKEFSIFNTGTGNIQLYENNVDTNVVLLQGGIVYCHSDGIDWQISVDYNVTSDNSLTPSQILEKIKTVDGNNSGLDADLLDGLHSTDFLQGSAGNVVTLQNSSGGWHKIFRFPLTDVDARVDFLISGTFGSNEKGYLKSSAFVFYSVPTAEDTFLSSTSFISQFRITQDATYYYLELFFASTSYSNITVSYKKTFLSGNNVEYYTGTLPIGSGTVIASSPLSLGKSDVWTPQNDGSGSGLDADLLDGLHSTSFARITTVPATATSTGSAGQIAYDTNFFYVCVATNTWRRTALSSW